MIDSYVIFTDDDIYFYLDSLLEGLIYPLEAEARLLLATEDAPRNFGAFQQFEIYL